MLDPITPQSNPEFFYTRIINGHAYYVPNVITWEIKRAMEKADVEAFRAAKPEDCKPDVDFVKFNLWLATDEGELLTNCAEAKVLFLPKDGAPPVDFRTMPFVTFREAKNFIERPLPSSDSVPTDATAAKSVKKRASKSNAVTPQA